MVEELHRLSLRLDELIEFSDDKSQKVKYGLGGLGVGAGTVGAAGGLYARGVRGALLAHGRPGSEARLVIHRGITGNIKAGAKLLPGDIKRHVINPVTIGSEFAKIPEVREAYSHDLRASLARKFERTARNIRR
jgi:hypothetical protein